jgi:pimeloyl-ACP methyl ester carboxylesterase
MVMLIHGIWMPGIEMTLLQRRLRQCGFRTRIFLYSSTRASMADNARRLDAYVRELDEPRLHFVAHSLGGLLVRKLFQDYPDQPPGRIVSLGSPHAGSCYARHLTRYGIWRRLFGRSLSEGGLPDAELPDWQGQRDFGVIAGNHNVGTGVMLGDLAGRGGDGIVALDETHLPGETDYIQIRAVHTGLLFNREAAGQVCNFLKSGHFDPKLEMSGR